MSAVTCPHCGSPNIAAAAFCESCGKALPIAATGSTGPRVVTADSLPASAAGQQMLSEQLKKTTKRAANTLLVVGIVQLVLGSLFAVVMANAPGAAPNELPLLLGMTIVVALLFIGLSFWARKSPLPASIIGLVLYSTLIAINVITTLSALRDAPPGSRGGGIGGLGIGFLDILIMVFLARGIKAALDHRKLERGEAVAL